MSTTTSMSPTIGLTKESLTKSAIGTSTMKSVRVRSRNLTDNFMMQSLPRNALFLEVRGFVH